jgi:hypothetical protein
MKEKEKKEKNEYKEKLYVWEEEKNVSMCKK